MTSACEDWRALSPAVVEPLVDAEIAAWQSRLDWDIAGSWSSVEPARRAGQLPGVVIRDVAGRVAGWSCFLLHRRALQVAALVADDAGTTGALVEAIMASPEARRAESAIICVREAAPGLPRQLAAHGFGTARYRYLVAPAAAAASVALECRAWRSGDLVPASRLLARAYARTSGTRAFAPHGTPPEWLEYVYSLVASTGCGRLMPSASLVAPAADAREFDGVVLATRVGAATAHIAQIAVDPAVQRRGRARRLLAAASAATARDGCERVTLLVDAANVPAVRLYESAGFRDRSAFVVGFHAQPRRSTSVAFAGASARR